MAKKKRLNKRVVIFLTILGLVVVAGAVTVGIMRLPRDAGKLHATAVAQEGAGNYTQAEISYAQAIGALPKESPLAADYNYDLANMYMKWLTSNPKMPSQDWDQRVNKVYNTLKKALIINPSHVDSQRLTTEFYWRIINGEQATRDWPPYSKDAPSRRLFALLMTRPSNNWMPYIKEASAMLVLDPKNSDVLFNRAVANGALAQNLRGEYTEAARKDFKKAIELKSNESDYWLALAFFEQTIKSDKAEEVYTEAIKANPDKSDLLVAYAMYLTQQRRDSEALAQMEKAQEADKIAGTCLGSLALAEQYLNTVKFKEALDILVDVQKSHPQEARVYYDMARAYILQNNSDQAIAILKEGLKTLGEATTNPTSQPGASAPVKPQVAAANRAELNTLLINMLLDLATSKPKERDQYLAEAKAAMASLETVAPIAYAKVNGRIQYVEGKLDESAKTLEGAFSVAPDPAIALLLTQIYLQQDKPGKAEDMADKMGGITGLLAKAQIQLSYMAYDEAYRTLQKALMIDAKNSQAQEIKMFLEAVRTGALPKDIVLSDVSAGRYMELARRMALENKTKEAVALAEELHKRMPDNLNITAGLATLYMQTKNEDKAQTLLESMSDKVKDNKGILQVLELLKEKDPKQRTEIQLRNASDIEKAMIYLRNKDEVNFQKYLKEAAAKTPNNQMVIELQFGLALKDKNLEAAKDCVKRATGIDPVLGKMYDARLTLGDGKDPQNVEKTISILQEALRERPDSKPIQVMIGELYFNTGNVSKAESYFSDVLAVDPGYSPALVGMAHVTEQLGRWTEHDKLVDRAYRIVPQDEYIRNEYRRIEDDRLKPEDAIRNREEVRQSKPGDVSNLLRLAGLYEKNKQIDKAEEIYRLVYDNLNENNKLSGANMLLEFYVRNGKNNNVETVLNDLTRNPTDKVGAWITYGRIRMAQNTPDSAKQANEAFQKAIAADMKDPRGYRAMASLLGSQGKMADAAVQMRKAVEFQPSPANSKLYAKYLIDSGNLEEATRQLNIAMAAEPKDAEALSDMAIILNRQNKSGEAEQMLNKAIEYDPNFVDALLRRAVFRMAAARNDDARADLETMQSKATTPDQLRQVAAAYLRLGDEDAAVRILREVRQKYDNYPPATMDLGRIYLKQKNWVQLDPMLVEGEKNAVQKVPFYVMHAESYRSRLMHDKRAAMLEQAYKLQTDRGIAVEYAIAMIDGNFLTKAVEFTTKTQQDEPANVVVMKALQARALVQLKKTQEGENLFREVLITATPNELPFVLDQMQKAFGDKEGVVRIEFWKDSWPKSWEFYASLGEWYAKTKTPESLKKALDMLDKAIAAAPSDAARGQLNILLGMTYHDLKDFKKAEEMYLSAVKILGEQNAPQCLNNLAYLYANDMNNPAEALKYAKRALALMPDNVNVLDTYGWALIKSGQLDKTTEDVLLKAIAGENSPFVCRYHLGYLYEKTGRPAEAKTQYKAGLDMVPADDPMRATLQESYDRVNK